MKKLENFKDSKILLKEVQGGRGGNPCPVSGVVITDRPSDHPDGPGEYHWVHRDFNEGSYY